MRRILIWGNNKVLVIFFLSKKLHVNVILERKQKLTFLNIFKIYIKFVYFWTNKVLNTNDYAFYIKFEKTKNKNIFQNLLSLFTNWTAVTYSHYLHVFLIIIWNGLKKRLLKFRVLCQALKNVIFFLNNVFIIWYNNISLDKNIFDEILERKNSSLAINQQFDSRTSNLKKYLMSSILHHISLAEWYVFPWCSFFQLWSMPKWSYLHWT